MLISSVYIHDPIGYSEYLYATGDIALILKSIVLLIDPTASK